jgi:uncharacterized protein YdaU (DUF1376 family)
MSGVPYIRFFGDDWLSGTQELSLEERGALITIVALTATTGNGPEADYKRLARRFGCTPGRAKKIIMSLVDLGKITIEDGNLNNRRALIETKNSQKNSKKQSEKANHRWSKKAEKDNKNKAGGDAAAMPGQCQPEPEPEPYTTTTVPKSGDLREPDPPPKAAAAVHEQASGQSALSQDQLYDAVLSAVGHRSGNLPTHWMPPAAPMHVDRWRTDLGLTDAQIISAARESRKRHDQAPNGPKALDRVMANVAAQLTAPKLKPISAPSAKGPRKHFEVMAERMAKTGTDGA